MRSSGTQVIAGTWTGWVQVFSADTVESLWQFDTNPAPSEEAKDDESVSRRAHGGAGDITRIEVSTMFVLDADEFATLRDRRTYPGSSHFQ